MNVNQIWQAAPEDAAGVFESYLTSRHVAAADKQQFIALIKKILERYPNAN